METNSRIQDNLLELIDSNYSKFMDVLYCLGGVEEDSFTILCDALRECKIQWKSKDCIPKQAAIIFVDAYAAIVSTTDLYKSTDKKEEIMHSADLLQDLIRDCCMLE
jgi:hypothetical protein